MKHCHVANGQGHPDEKYQNSVTGRQTFPDRGAWAKAPHAHPVAPHLINLLHIMDEIARSVCYCFTIKIHLITELDFM